MGDRASGEEDVMVRLGMRKGGRASGGAATGLREVACWVGRRLGEVRGSAAAEAWVVRVG